MHYMRWVRHGDPLRVAPKPSRRRIRSKRARYPDVEARFLAKVSRLPSGCWKWTGSTKRTKQGYGSFTLHGAEAQAHRWAYERWIGPVPNGGHLDHYLFPQDGCVGPACVNPAHVRIASPRENILRGDAPSAWNAAKTHCPRGHSYSGENLYINPRGSRICRACKRASARRSADRLRWPHLVTT